MSRKSSTREKLCLFARDRLVCEICLALFYCPRQRIGYRRAASGKVEREAMCVRGRGKVVERRCDVVSLNMPAL